MRFPSPMSHRKEQVESTLQRAISEVLMRSMSDPRIAGMVSIQRVHVSDDFKVADVFVSVLPAKFEKKTLGGLRAAAGHIHAKVFKAVAMRGVPRFVFQIDEAHKKESAVFDAIAQAMDREGLDPSQIVHNLNPPVEADDELDEDEEELEEETDELHDEADDSDDDSAEATQDDDDADIDDDDASDDDK